MRISDWSSDVCSSDLLVRQCEPAFYPAERAEIRTDMASGRAFDRADERSRQHGLPGLDASAVSGQAIDEPRYRTGRIAQHARTEAGLFDCAVARHDRSEEHTSELQSLMRTSYAVCYLKKKNTNNKTTHL